MIGIRVVLAAALATGLAAFAGSAAQSRQLTNRPDVLVFGLSYDYDEPAYRIVTVQPNGRALRTLARGGAHDPLWSPTAAGLRST